MKTVYVVIDWDYTETIRAFAQRRNAIQYAYEHCEAFGAHLSTTIKTWGISGTIWQYQNLADVIGDNDPIDYLNTLSDKDLNDVFYEYYFLKELKIEDVGNHGEG